MLDQYKTITLMPFDGSDRYWITNEDCNALADESTVSAEYILKALYTQLENKVLLAQEAVSHAKMIDGWDEIPYELREAIEKIFEIIAQQGEMKC